MGHAISGEGFFCLQYPEDSREEPQIQLGANAAVLSMPSSVLTHEILQVELPHLFEGDWDWQIAQVGDNDFAVVFPSADLLHMAKTSGKLFLSINNITADIRDAALAEPKALSMPELWVKMWGIPPKQRRTERLMAATTMIGAAPRGG